MDSCTWSAHMHMHIHTHTFEGTVACASLGALHAACTLAENAGWSLPYQEETVSS